MLLECSQFLPVRPSEKGGVTLTTLGWLQAVVSDRARGILVF
jgi:hypothetical protein